MDRIRTDMPHPTILKIRRLAGAGAALFAIVFAVGSLPVLFVYFWSGPIEAPTSVWQPEIEVSYPSGDIRLAGSLHLPSGPGPYPAAVVVHGSGRQTRDYGSRVAGQLLPLGIAVLSYDKRGVGGSGGRYSGVGVANGASQLATLADDALAGIEFLAQRPDIDARRMGLVGISQAGWIIPLAASKDPRVAFTVIVSGPTVSVGEEIYFSRLTGDDFGTPTDLDDAELSRRLSRFDGDPGFDPRPVLGSLSVPGLWLFGSLDRSMPVPESVAILKELQGDGRPYEYRVYSGANHGLVDLKSGDRVDYWPDVRRWLERQLGL